jgi:hypothetical protein
VSMPRMNACPHCGAPPNFGPGAFTNDDPIAALRSENAKLRECLQEYVKAYPAVAIASWRREIHSSREDRAKALLGMQDKK